MDLQKALLALLSILVTISLALSAHTFKSIEGRVQSVESKVDNRIERIAILEQQAKENSDAHARIESKVDRLIILLRK